MTVLDPKRTDVAIKELNTLLTDNANLVTDLNTKVYGTYKLNSVGSRIASTDSSGKTLKDEYGNTIYEREDGGIIFDIAEVKSDLVTTKELIADKATIEDLTATNATIKNLEADNVTINGTIDSLKVKNEEIEKLVADKIDAKEVEANYAHITDGVIDNANIDFANINNVKITNADIEDATITSAKIESINGNKITDGSIVAKALSSQVIETLSNTNVYYQATDPTEGMSAEDIASKFQDGDLWYKTLVATEDGTTDDETTDPQLNLYEYIYEWGNITDDETETATYGWITLGESQNRIVSGSITSQEIATDTITANNINGGHITLEWCKTTDDDGNTVLDKGFESKFNEWQDSSLVYNKWAEFDGEKLVFSENITDENTDTTTNAKMELTANAMTFSNDKSAMELTSSSLEFDYDGDEVASIRADDTTSYFAIGTSKQAEILLRESPTKGKTDNICNLGIVAQSNGHISLKEVN